MTPFPSLFLLVTLTIAAHAQLAVPTGGAVEQPHAHPLVWDAMEKSYEVKPGEGAAEFSFSVTNTSRQPVEILEIRPSCTCTIAEMPNLPWVLAPGANGSFRATVDIRGKHGRIAKALFVNSTAGTQMLGVIVSIPETDEAMRQRNQQVALADRQAVFRNDCAACHAAPIGEKTGAELFQVACVICHATERRATMVPDLLTAREHRDAAFWRKWIAEGRERTLMPAFARAAGGPLTDAQIESLVKFALAQLPTEPRKN